MDFFSLANKRLWKWLCFTLSIFVVYNLKLILSKKKKKNPKVKSLELCKCCSDFTLKICLGFFVQVGLPIILSEMRSKKRSSNKVKFLNSVLLFQYGPRILQIYLSWKKLIRSDESVDETLWVKAILNFFLYILAGHVSLISY